MATRTDTIKYEYPLSDEFYLELARSFYTPLIYGENSILIAPPVYGRDHNFNYLRERKQDRDAVLGSYRNRFDFITVQLSGPDIGNDSDWLRQFVPHLTFVSDKNIGFDEFAELARNEVNLGQELVFMVNIPESFTDEQFVSFLRFAQKVYYIAASRIHLLLFFDMRWDEVTFSRLITPFRSLFQNTTRLAEYSDGEVLHLLKHFCEKWNYPVNAAVLNYIIDQSGGVLLLAKAMLRIIVKEKLQKLNEVRHFVHKHPEFILQMDFFMSALTQTQQETLKNIANGVVCSDTRELQHLVALKIVKALPGGYTLRSKALESYLGNNKNAREQLIVYINQADLFSNREKRLLIELLVAPGGMLSREAVAEILWDKQQLVVGSDWAIDQTVSRLRRKIAKLPLLAHLSLISHKKKGFSLK